MSIVKKVIRKGLSYLTLTPLLKRTNWYKNLFLEDIYPGNIWYREHGERNYDLVVLGSSGAKWGFDFSDSSIKAMNWAQAPQTLLESYNLLRNFHSILRKQGIVIMTIMPFTSLNNDTGLYDALKYVKVHSHEPIQPYLYVKARKCAEFPILLGKPAIKAIIKGIIGKDKSLDSKNSAQKSNPMSSEELDQNALRFINGWKRQFAISDFNAPLTEGNQKGRKYRIALMRSLVDFCVERDYRVVFVIPPVTEHLSKYYTPVFEEIYIYSFLRELERDVLTLDYSKDETLKDDKLYFNSFFMNKQGAAQFTNKVLKDLKLI